MRKLLVIVLVFFARQVLAQDTTHKLQEVTVHGFEQQSRLLDVPAAINYISPATLARYGNTSIVNAINSLPGVRMEERSPGSYRLNVRGSSLRAPFGVRNVKIYYNDIPFTDPGGTTYLNQIGYYNINSIEIIKGPGSSIYGAGTGGTVLIQSMPGSWNEGATAAFTGGSFGLANTMGEVRFGKENFKNVIRYQHFSSDGYREQSNMKRDVVSWDVLAKIDTATTISTHFLYSDLMYQTPGGLTFSEYDSDATMARPAAGISPGAVNAKAAIYQKMFLVGLTLKHQFNVHWANTLTLYGMYSQLYNPGIRNYGKSSEPNIGGRSVLKYNTRFWDGSFNWLVGAEVQQNFTTQQTYRNLNGNPDTLQTDEIVRNRNLLGFTQVSLELHGWSLTAGLSISRLRLLYARLSSMPYQEQTIDFNNEFSPRIALFKSWVRALSAYATIARGFSPPTSSELSPSGGVLNDNLQAEYGWNHEVGLRGYLVRDRFYYDVNGYYFSLNNSIVQRRDAAGGDYYLNSGGTKQWGAEAYLCYVLLEKGKNNFGELSAWVSYTYQQFRYKNFKQLDNDFSGNALPGVAPHTFTCGVDVQSKIGVYGNVNYYYSDAFALNDANTDMNKPYNLLGFKAGYSFMLFRKSPINIFLGGDNLLNVNYNSGPDINAFGGRYYNASTGRNFYAGISMGYNR